MKIFSNFYATSIFTAHQPTATGLFLKVRVILPTLSLPVLAILHFIIFLTTKTNFLNIFSSFGVSRLHYTFSYKEKLFYLHVFPNLCDFINTSLICSILIIQTCSCVCVSVSHPGSHFRIQ